VSTIHKAKGKEFDNIFLLLRNGKPETDEAKRLLYVAITRPKSNLFIHYDGNYLKPISGEEVIYEEDKKLYPAPQQIAMYLTHKDVYLGYFEFVQRRMHDRISGASLFVMDEGLGNSNRELILKYSKKFMEDLQNRLSKGFRIQEAKINFIIYWKDEAKEKEIKIILPQLLLVKQ